MAFKRIVDTSGTTEGGEKTGSIKPDGSIYPNYVPEESYTKKEKFYFNAGCTEAVVELKPRSLNPINNPHDADDSSTTSVFSFDITKSYSALNPNDRKKCQAIGQIVRYAAETLARQHRLSCFLIFITGRLVYFFRFDRAGAIISSPFNCTESPELLCQFVWRLSHLDKVQRGYDRTISWASNEERELFLATIRNHIKSDPLVSAIVSPTEREAKVKQALDLHYHAEKVTVLEVFNETDKSSHRYIVSRPVVSPTSVAGRCTRGYWAVNAETGKLVFLKDTWRISSLRARIEGHTLKTLNEANVRNVPVLKHQGDVDNGCEYCSLRAFHPRLTGISPNNAY